MADRSSTAATSSREPTLVLLSNLLNRPKHQSGAMAYQKKGNFYLIIKAYKYPPHKILHHKVALVLATAVVGMKVEVGFTKSMVIEKMM